MEHRQSPLSPEGTDEPYRNIFESASDALILTDSETGTVVEANPAAYAMHGYSREAFIGLHASVLIHPDSQHVFGNYMRAVRSGAAVDTRVLHVRRNGSTFHGEWRGTAFSYQDQPCLLGTVRDVSRHIQADQRLQQRVEARTRSRSVLLEISHALASTLELQPGRIWTNCGGPSNTRTPGFSG